MWSKLALLSTVFASVHAECPLPIRLEACTAEAPLVFKSGCPSCAPTGFDVAACRRERTPMCNETNIAATPFDATDCPTCFVGCRPDFCAEGDVSTMLDTGCPSCITRCPVPTARCTEGQDVEGADGCRTCFPTETPCMPTAPCVLDACDGVAPEFDRSTCCATCKYVRDASCTEEAKEACRAGYDSLAACTDGNNTSDDCGCPTCKRDLPVKSDPETTCTKIEFDACATAAGVCASNELPVFSRERCCASCVPAPRRCPIDVVADCAVGQRECDGNERPTWIATAEGGDCCSSCVLPKPTCAEECADNEVCTRNGCATREEVRFTLRSLGQAKIAFIRSVLARLESASEEEREAGVAQIRALITEMVERFCARAENSERCELAFSKFIASMKVRVQRKMAGQDSLDCRLDHEDAKQAIRDELASRRSQPTDVSPAARRLLQEVNSLLQDALDSQAEEEGFTVDNVEVQDGTTSSAARVSTQAAALAAFAALAVVAF